ncbi:MAG: hydrolase [Proteiniphilum sp.]|nr:hydrolase [Proteiniphilum sp.]MDD4159066.1 hydrolase [Proteiniphilum sp.]MDD4799779.1 hydrolase [Proteiniphilum sp.]
MMILEHLPEENSGRSNPGITRREAFALLEKYNKEPFHIQHAETVEAVMRYFAGKLGYADEADFWGLVGLLHDLDFEQFPEEHCIKVREIFDAEGINPEIKRAVVSHAYGIMQQDVKPEHQMEKVLYATDELTGLIGAVILMRPGKSTLDLTVQSLKKKFKDKKFAAGCSRDVIREGADLLGWELDYLMEQTIRAMQEKERAE